MVMKRGTTGSFSLTMWCWCTNAIAKLPSPTADATRYHRAGANVGAREDARDARLEQVQVAVERPAALGAHVGTGEHVAGRALTRRSFRVA